LSVSVQVVEDVTQCTPCSVVGTVAGPRIVLDAVAALPQVVVKFPVAGYARKEPAVPEEPAVTVVCAVSVVNAPVLGVVPPIAPGDGREVVEPPRDTAVPAIVMDECARPELAREAFVVLLRFTTSGEVSVPPKSPANSTSPTCDVVASGTSADTLGELTWKVMFCSLLPAAGVVALKFAVDRAPPPFTSTFVPPLPDPQVEPVPLTTPELLTFKHCVDPVMLLKVSAGIVTVPVKVGDASGASEESSVPLSAIWPLVPVNSATSRLVLVVGPVVIPEPEPARAFEEVIVVALPAIATCPVVMPETPLLVRHVEQEIAPPAEIEIGAVPLSPALPTLPMGRYWKVGYALVPLDTRA